MTDDLGLGRYAGYIVTGIGVTGVSSIGILLTWIKLSRIKTDVSGDSMRRANDESMRKTIALKDREIERERIRYTDLETRAVARVRELESQNRALNDIALRSQNAISMQADRIKRLENRVSLQSGMLAEEGGENAKLIKVFANTNFSELR